MSTAEPFLLHVVFNGRVIGDVRRTGKRQMRLRYDPAVVTETWFTPLSLSMPASTLRHREKTLEPWLDGLLPDRPELLRQWGRRFAITDERPFSLLEHVGEDLAGAAQFVRPDRLDAVLADQGSLTLLTDDDVAERLRRAMADLPIIEESTSTGKFSLAGAQAKIALHHTDDGWADPSGATPSTHILKPAIPGMTDQDLAEHITMTAAAAIGLRVADSTVAVFGDERALVTTRYDRVNRGDSGSRVHQEDMCQALGEWPRRKYQSQGGPGPARIADLLAACSSEPETDTRRFAAALVFNWLICGTDAHARNYSVLLNRDQVRLAPLYDLNSYLGFSDGVGSDLSMSVDGVFRASAITAARWRRCATTLRVDEDWLVSEVARQASHLPDAVVDASKADTVAGFKSPLVQRMVEAVSRWVEARA